MTRVVPGRERIQEPVRDGRLPGRARLRPGAGPILVAGGANLDRVAKAAGPVAMGSSNPVTVRESLGGVARNVAENLVRLGLPVRLMTVVGDDPQGAALLEQARALGIDTSPTLAVPGCPTGTYTALLQPDGEMVLAMADMGVMDHFTMEALQERRSHWASTRRRVLDGNLPPEVLAALVEDSRERGAMLALVAVSEPKMGRLPRDLRGVTVLILNAGELAARVARPLPDLEAVLAACRRVQAQGVQGLVVTLGPEGVLCVPGTGEPRHFPAPGTEIVDVTGAGDAFSAGVVAGLAQVPGDLPRACRLGQKLAAITLGSRSSVAPSLTPDLLRPEEDPES